MTSVRLYKNVIVCIRRAGRAHGEEEIIDPRSLYHAFY